jgi:hypothetical protein
MDGRWLGLTGVVFGSKVSISLPSLYLLSALLSTTSKDIHAEYAPQRYSFDHTIQYSILR